MHVHDLKHAMTTARCDAGVLLLYSSVTRYLNTRVHHRVLFPAETMGFIRFANNSSYRIGQVEQGNVADADATTAVHHRKVGNHY